MYIKIVINRIFTVFSPNSGTHQSAEAGGLHPDPSPEQMTLLSLVRQARVTVESLTVATDGEAATPPKTSSVGKPPRPLGNKKW